MSTAPSKPPGRQTDEAGQAVRSCDACLRKGIQCTTTARQTNPRVRSGRRIEAAREMYGSTAIATPSTPSTTRDGAPPSYNSAEAHLANDLQVETLRLDLLELYERMSGPARYPLWQAPLFNYYDLLQRFKSSNQDIGSLEPHDQLLLRIVAASASRFLQPSRSPKSSRDCLADRIVQLTVRLADSHAIWRTVSKPNSVALLLLWQAMTNGEIASATAQPHLAAAVNQTKVLRDHDRPELEDDSATWATALMDAVVALEASSAPILSNRFRFFSRIARIAVPLADVLLPSLDQLVQALGTSDPWILVESIAPILCLACFSVRRLAYALEDIAQGNFSALRICEAEWPEMDKVYHWVDRASAFVMEQAAITKPFCRALLEMYTSLIAAITIFSDLAILRAAEDAAAEHGRMCSLFLDATHERAESGACRFLRVVRKYAARNYLACFAGSFYSASRVAVLTEVFIATPAWDVNLHPQGAADKLASLFFLREAVRNIAIAYPSSALASAHDAIDREISSLQRVVDGPLLFDSTAPASSLTQVAAWLFDRSDRNPKPYLENPDASVSPPSDPSNSLPPCPHSQTEPPPPSSELAPPFESQICATSYPFPNPSAFYVALDPPMWTFQPAHVLNERMNTMPAPASVPHYPSFPDAAQAYAFPAQAYPPAEQDSYPSHFSS
ncbi:hypothetical protein JCM10021v2_000577 [Rhodotorula toruloides]